MSMFPTMMRAAALALLSSSAVAQVPIDPYPWLMPIKGEQALAWSAQQTAATTATLQASPAFKAVMADMRDVHARSTTLPRYYKIGRRYLRLTTGSAHPYGLLETAVAGPDGKPGAWKTALDLDAYNKTVPLPYSIKWLQPLQECRPPSYDRCMIPLWPNGEQHNEYRELDLNTGQFVENGFHIGPSRTSLAWLDADTLAVAHSTEGAPALSSQFPQNLYLWKRGTPLAQAPMIFHASPQDSLFFAHVMEAGGKRHIIVALAKTYTAFQLMEISPDGKATDLPIPTTLNNFGEPSFTRGRIVVQLAAPQTIDGKAYPADSIISYDLETGRIGLVMAPPQDTYLSGDIVTTRDGVLLVANRHLQRILYSAVPEGDGWKVEQRMVQPAGMTMNLTGSGEDGDGALVQEQGLLVPPRVSLIGTAAAPTLLAAEKPIMDLSGYTVDIRSTRSEDGMSVDYYLMHRRGQAPHPVPTILDGYGGFGVSEEPRYFGYRLGASWKAWYDRGGAFAVAAVRGGGERGGAWHLAGAGIHKKKMFDDFNAVAEALEQGGFTDPQHLGIMGHSNGGILVSGAETMRPDLYGAVLAGAPVTDFFSIGHGDGGIGAGMATEFGDANDPAQVPTILIWSPYQNIRPGVRYPPTLSYVATTDTQVGPSHARKLIARLQSVGAPAMLLEGTEGGHDFPSEYTQTPDTAMLMTFFEDNLMK